MDNLKHNHYAHAVGIAAILYLVTKNIGISAGVGIGAGLYMQRFGHSLPNMTESKPNHTVQAHVHDDSRDHTHHTFNPLHRTMTL